MALVVAVNSYTDEGLSSLAAPAADAAALAEVLGDPALGGFEVDVAVDATDSAIRQRIEGLLADRRQDDVVLLHFSCHGIKDSNGELVLAATNTSTGLLASTGVEARWVSQRLRRTHAGSVVLLLDCCFGGAFERGLVPRTAGAVDVMDQFRSEHPEQGRGLAIITASTAVEYAFEDARLIDARTPQPSFFTDAVVEGIRSGDADADRDGYVSFSELYRYVHWRVRQRTTRQTPSMWQFGVEGSLYIARSPRSVDSHDGGRGRLRDSEKSLLELVDTDLDEVLRYLRLGGYGPIAEEMFDAVLRAQQTSNKNLLDWPSATVAPDVRWERRLQQHLARMPKDRLTAFVRDLCQREVLNRDDLIASRPLLLRLELSPKIYPDLFPLTRDVIAQSIVEAGKLTEQMADELAAHTSLLAADKLGLLYEAVGRAIEDGTLRPMTAVDAARFFEPAIGKACPPDERSRYVYWMAHRLTTHAFVDRQSRLDSWIALFIYTVRAADTRGSESAKQAAYGAVDALAETGLPPEHLPDLNAVREAARAVGALGRLSERAARLLAAVGPAVGRATTPPAHALPTPPMSRTDESKRFEPSAPLNKPRAAASGGRVAETGSHLRSVAHTAAAKPVRKPPRAPNTIIRALIVGIVLPVLVYSLIQSDGVAAISTSPPSSTAADSLSPGSLSSIEIPGSPDTIVSLVQEKLIMFRQVGRLTIFEMRLREGVTEDSPVSVFSKLRLLPDFQSVKSSHELVNLGYSPGSGQVSVFISYQLAPHSAQRFNPQARAKGEPDGACSNRATHFK